MTWTRESPAGDLDSGRVPQRPSSTAALRAIRFAAMLQRFEGLSLAVTCASRTFPNEGGAERRPSAGPRSVEGSRSLGAKAGAGFHASDLNYPVTNCGTVPSSPRLGTQILARICGL